VDDVLIFFVDFDSYLKYERRWTQSQQKLERPMLVYNCSFAKHVWWPFLQCQ
jgi:hypothetical protein